MRDVLWDVLRNEGSALRDSGWHLGPGPFREQGGELESRG
jgi:hypothetical protein